ncbi:MAG: hypothetical protein Q9164_006800 [Protoblastenia rupestris]
MVSVAMPAVLQRDTGVFENEIQPLRLSAGAGRHELWHGFDEDPSANTGIFTNSNASRTVNVPTAGTVEGVRNVNESMSESAIKTLSMYMTNIYIVLKEVGYDNLINNMTTDMSVNSFGLSRDSVSKLFGMMESGEVDTMAEVGTTLMGLTVSEKDVVQFFETDLVDE